tara:strand:+ start:2462 stop:4108 length:1647 start_codon:yes stop_codon:yes gene_type:complete
MDERVPMRDSIELSTDVYLPDIEGQFPTVLIRTPYGNSHDSRVRKALNLCSTGYAVAIQDVRGRWDSDGEWNPWHCERNDGEDTIHWLSQQAWCNTRIGMIGSSYSAFTQWEAARSGAEHLKCIIPRVAPSDIYSGVYYRQGAFQLFTALGWSLQNYRKSQQPIEMYDWESLLMSLPLMDMDKVSGKSIEFFRDWLKHDKFDDFWERIDLQSSCEVQIPVLSIGGWYDLFADGTVANFLEMRSDQAVSNEFNKLIMGPWAHPLENQSQLGDMEFGSTAHFDLDDLENKWLDRWLKGEHNEIEKMAPVTVFVMGANQWKEESEWPPQRSHNQRLYLHSDGQANTVNGDGVLSFDAPSDDEYDEFTYDPKDPVPTLGGNTCCFPELVPWGPKDQQELECRSDILCYTSAVLEEGLEIMGMVTVVIHASSDAVSTDFTAKLIDVYPFGESFNVVDGIVRATCRDTCLDPNLIEPGEVYKYQIELGPTAIVFRKGHRIRLHISSSNFPRFDRNLNTGDDFAFGSECSVAHQRVYHSEARPSYVLLPVTGNGQ